VSRESTVSSLKDVIAATGVASRTALNARLADLPDAVPSLPQTPVGCFTFLSRIGFTSRENRALAHWNRAASANGVAAPHAIERYLVLQAATVALDRLAAFPADDDCKRNLCATLALVATNETDPRLSFEHDAFAELARLVTLRRLHCGQFSFDIARPSLGALAAWTLSLHPRDLPRWIFELVACGGAMRPVLSPHICYWRESTGHITAEEQIAALLRAAKTLTLNPDVPGLMGVSWLLSREVGASFPHLAFARDIFVDNGARAFDLGPARATDGFLIGSERRRRLYAEGRFCPQMGCVFWRRDAFLSWAAAMESARYAASTSQEKSQYAIQPPPARASRHQSSRHWTRFRRFLFRSPKLYAGTVIIAPAILGAVLATQFAGLIFAAPGFLAAAGSMWLFQSFVLQR
jgi:hypothetical protein